jgi:hypothetical protein
MGYCNIFSYSFIAIKFKSKLGYCILLSILNLSLPIQWMLIMGFTPIWVPYVYSKLSLN